MYRVVFLLGAMRSGTTYFRNILSGNRNIQVLGSELNRLWTEVGKAPCGLVRQCPPRAASDASAAIKSDITHHFSAQYQKRNSLSKCIYRAYRQVRYGNESLVKRGYPYYLLNKSTHLLNKIPYIDSIFPEALYIYLLRQPHSQAYSLYQHFKRLEKAGWAASYPQTPARSCWSFERSSGGEEQRSIPFQDIPRYWIEQNRIAIDDLGRLALGRVLYVTYEELATKPHAILSRLAPFLGVDALDSRFSRKRVNYYCGDPLSDWEKHLSVEQLDSINSMLADCRSDVESIFSHFHAS